MVISMPRGQQVERFSAIDRTNIPCSRGNQTADLIGVNLAGIPVADEIGYPR
jgi:hypothetical protein